MKASPAPAFVGTGDVLLFTGVTGFTGFTRSVKGGIVGVEVLFVEAVLCDAEGIADFSHSNMGG